MEIKITSNTNNNNIEVSSNSCGAKVDINTPDPFSIITVVSGGASGKDGEDGSVILPFVSIGDALVKKLVTNTNNTIQEIGDIIYFKKVDDNGEMVMLIGHTYIGGDITLYTSYSKDTIIDL